MNDRVLVQFLSFEILIRLLTMSHAGSYGLCINDIPRQWHLRKRNREKTGQRDWKEGEQITWLVRAPIVEHRSPCPFNAHVVEQQRWFQITIVVQQHIACTTQPSALRLNT